MLPEPPADVSALDEVYVVLVVAAWSHQDTQEVQIVTQVLDERRPHAAENKAGELKKTTTFFSMIAVITSGE